MNFAANKRVSLRSAYTNETFAAYRFEEGFADKDPEGYHMVEAILRMVFGK